MKKLFCILLSVLLLLPVIASFGVGAAAESTYEELWAEKIAYEKEDGFISLGEASENVVNICYGDDFAEGGDSFGYEWGFLLYTEQGQKLTYQYENYRNEVVGYNISWGYDYWDGEENRIITCTELREMIDSCMDLDPSFAEIAQTSCYRNVVQTLDITLEELRAAYRRMKEEPEYARKALSFMTDEEFKNYLSHGLRRTAPPDFVIEAACLADDDQAEMLLAVPGNVYIKERGYTISCMDIYYGADTRVEEFKKFDLTTDSFVKFFDDMGSSNTVEYRFGPIVGKDGRTPGEKHDYLLAEYNRQLKAAQTGDNAMTALWVIAFALPTLAAVVTVRRKRKI